MIPAEGLAGAVAALPPDPVVVAVGGGADSAVAAWLAVEHRDLVRAVHVHHGTSAADLLEESARKLCAHLGLELSVIRIQVPPGPSFENAARIERHRAIAADLRGAERVVTGHHLDDQAETVLWHVVRGAGAAGVAGIPPQRDRVVRPLLGVRRSDIRMHAAALGLPFTDDPANADEALTRTKMGTEVIPFVESVLGRSIVEPLGRLGELARSDDEALETLAAHVPVVRGDTSVAIAVGALGAEHPAVASRVVRAALRAVRPPYGGSRAEVSAVLAVASGQPGVTIEGAWRVAREGPYVVIYQEAQHDEAMSPAPLQVPGVTMFGDTLLHATRTNSRVRPLSPALVLATRQSLEGAVVRVTTAGERIDLGDGSKPVRDAMAEAGVPPRLRALWPVVSVGGKIAWIVGVRVAAWLSAAQRIDPGDSGRVLLSSRRVET